MNPLNDLLRDADPLPREAGPSDDDVDRIRRAILNTRPEPPRRHWSGSLVLASALALMVVLLVTRLPGSKPPVPADTAATPGATASSPGAARERRQLQFATPGGTRVIWVFDSTFEMR